MAVLLFDQEPILTAVPDPVSADDVVGAAGDSEVDARMVSVNDDVVRDQVAAAVLDPDPVAASEDPVPLDHVVAA